MARAKSGSKRGYYAQQAYERGEYQQLSLIETVPEFTIPWDAFTSCMVSYKEITSSGATSGSTSSQDHPAFQNLRQLLANRDFIHMVTNSSNGDQVQKPFILNGHRFTTGDQFCCASAHGVTHRMAKNKQIAQTRERSLRSERRRALREKRNK